MQADERKAAEEAEKRLKAALTAKREPTSTTSRIGSPAVGDTSTEQKPASQSDDVAMENTEHSEPAPEVRPFLVPTKMRC